MLGMCLSSHFCEPCKDGVFGHGNQVEEMTVSPPHWCSEILPHPAKGSELVRSAGALSERFEPVELQQYREENMANVTASAFSDAAPAQYANQDAVASASSGRIRDAPTPDDGAKPPRPRASSASACVTPREDSLEESMTVDEESSTAGKGRKQVTLRPKKNNNICCNQRGSGNNRRNCMFMFGFDGDEQEAPETVDRVQLFVSHVVLDQLHDPDKCLPHGGYGTIVKVSVMETRVDGSIRFLALSDMALSIIKQDGDSGWLCLWGTGTCLNLGKNLIAGLLELRVLVETVGIDAAPRVAGTVHLANGAEALKSLVTASDRTFRLQFGEQSVGEVACSFHNGNLPLKPVPGDAGRITRGIGQGEEEPRQGLFVTRGAPITGEKKTL